MKFKTLIVAFLALSCNVIAQKTSREYFNLNYVSIPSKLIYDQIKTYSVDVSSIGTRYGYSLQELESLAGGLVSYKKVPASEANLKINYRIGPFTLVDKKVESGYTEDSKTKVKKYYYYVVYSYKIEASMEVYNAANGIRLLSNYLPANVVTLGNSLSVGTSYTSGDALNNWNNNEAVTVTKSVQEQIAGFMSRSRSMISNEFDFVNTKEQITLFKLKKCDIADQYNENLQKVIEALKLMTADEQPSQYLEKIKDQVAYFESYNDKFNPTDKKEDVLFFANNYNLASIYYCLDEFEKAKYYAIRLDNVNAKEAESAILATKINSMPLLLSKHFLTTRHLDYNPVQDYRLTGKKFKSDALSSAEATIQSLGKEGLNQATDSVYFANGTTGVGKIIYYKETNTYKLLPTANPDSTITLSTGNSNWFLMDNEKYYVIKVKQMGAVNKLITKSLFPSNKVVLFVAKEYGSVDMYCAWREGEATATELSGFGVKKTMAEYFKDCPSVSEKGRKGDYGTAMSFTKEKLQTLCTDYNNCQ